MKQAMTEQGTSSKRHCNQVSTSPTEYLEKQVVTLKANVLRLEAELAAAKTALSATLDELKTQAEATACVQEQAPSWADLPLELLAQVAAGRDSLKAMCLVCKAWRQVYAQSVQKVLVDLAAYRADSIPGVRSFDALRHLTISGNLEGLGLWSLRESAVDTLDLTKCAGVNPELLATLRGSHIHRLNLKGLLSVDDSCMATLVSIGLPLRVLGLGGTRVCDGGLEALEGLPDLACLAFAPFLRGNVTERGVWALTKLRALKELEVDEELNADADPTSSLLDFNCIRELKGMPLRRLYIMGNEAFSEEGFFGLEGMPLNELVLEDCSPVIDKGLFCLRGMPLLDLNITGCFPGNQLTAAGMQVFGELPLAKLHFLVFDDDSEPLRLDSVGVSFLRNLKLDSLSLGNFHLRDLDLLCLRGMPLADLTLYDCSSVSESAFASMLRGMPLRRLAVSGGNNISDAVLDTLLALPLQELELLDFPMLSKELQLALLAAKPGLKFARN